MEEKSVDLLVLGGGPGGYTAAFRAADLGLSVCLVEEGARLGGVCLNVGCIPSKTLIHGASLIEKVAAGRDYGLELAAPVVVDLEVFRAKKESVTAKLAEGLDRLVQARKIDRVLGRGYFKDTVSLQVQGAAGEQLLHFKKAVIATGSSPFVLPGLPDDPRIWNSTDALALKSVPARLLIIGGGVIGLEMARIYAAMGSEITIVEMLDHIIPPADKDLVQPLFVKLKRQYTIYTKTKVTEIIANEDGICAEFEGAKAPSQAMFDAVLVAVGRRPNSSGLGLSGIGVKRNAAGFIEVSETMQSSVSHIYGVGDVVGEPMLAHKASHEAKVAAEHSAGLDVKFCPKTIPSVAFTNPEIAWMGLTEKEAKAGNVAYTKGKFPWGASGRALSSGLDSGVTKILFEKESGRIIGAGICGAHAGELIHEVVLALEMGATASDIAGAVHAHPTLAETVGFAAEIVEGSFTDGMPVRKR